MDIELPGASVFVGDCIERMKQRPDGSVQMCVTSPPYYGLRDYGVDGQIGLEETPEQFIAKLVEVFREVRRLLADDGTCWVNIGDSYSRNPSKGGSGPGGKNGAYSGSYTAAQAARVDSSDYLVDGRGRAKTSTDNGIKHKDLIGIPWMLAFALRADGWYLRQEIIWHKPNPMPESVTDRCTKAHESLFLLSKSPQYFFDHNAIKEPAVGAQSSTGVGWNRTAAADPGDQRGMERGRTRRDSFKRDDSKRSNIMPGQVSATHRADRNESAHDITKRNRRSVWTIATKPYKGAHFAVFPPALVEPCILAGTSARGHCPKCSARWERTTGPAIPTGAAGSGNLARRQRPQGPDSQKWNHQAGSVPYVPSVRSTTGWAPICDCYDDQYKIAYPAPRNSRKRDQRAAWSDRWIRVRRMPGLQDWPVVADVVLDCFNGSGTTGEVALENGRIYEGFELNGDYMELTRTRLAGVIERMDAAQAERDAEAVQSPQMDMFAAI